MAAPELLDYIRQHLAAGTTRESIVSSLITAGWPKAMVDEAMLQFPTANQAPAPVTPPVAAAQPAVAVSQVTSPITETPVAAQPVAAQTSNAAYVMPGSWQLIKEAFKKFKPHIGLAYIFVAMLLVLEVIKMVVAETGSVYVMMISNTVVSLFSSIITIWGTAAITSALLNPENKRTIGQSLGQGARYIIPMAWTSFLLSAVALGGLVTIIIPLLASAWSLFITVILIEEDRRGMSVIVRAREFTRDRWWMIFGYSLMNGVMMMLLILPVIIVGTILLSVMGVIAGGLQTFSLILTAILAVLPFYLVTWTVCLYQHLKAKRGHAEPFPKPGQMKWYWILFGLGVLIPVLLIGLMGYKAIFALTAR